MKKINTDCFLEAFGEIDNNFITEARSQPIIKHKKRKITALIAAAALATFMTVTVAAVKFDFKGFFVEAAPSGEKELNVTEEAGPESIEKTYEPTYVPDGYINYNSELTKSHNYKWYRNGDDYFTFGQFLKKNYHNVAFGNENDVLEVFTGADGQEYMIVTSPEGISVVWDNGEYVFLVAGDLDRETALDICRLVEEKK